MQDLPGTTRPSLPRSNEKRLHGVAKSINHYVIGVDEAGRGPLAGPVVAAAFTILRTGKEAIPTIPINLTRGVTDSKQVTEDEREFLYHTHIKSNSGIKYKVSVVDNKTIDRINILQATFQAMTESATALIDEIRTKIDPSAKFSILIDGNKIPPRLAESEHVAEFLIKGDSIEFVIAAASICAKVERDAIMYALDKQFPMYGFGQHKGYPTGSHVAAVHAHGPCKHHRMTFAPIRHMKKAKSVGRKENIQNENNNSNESFKRKEALIVDPREERLKRRNILRGN